MKRLATTLLLVSSLLAGLLVVAIQPAAATSPGIPGVLAVIAGSDLALLDPITGVRTSLAPLGPEEESPSWSPDGARIAYSANDDLMVIDANGANETLLVGSPCGGVHPSWNADGTRILYQGGCGGLFTINPDGTDPLPLPNGTGKFSTEWSPDGTKIAYAAPSAGIQSSIDIWVMDADGQNPLQLTDIPGTQLRPSWSPDGTRISFQDQSDDDSVTSVGVVDVDGSDLANLTQRDGFDGSPTWSPDGASIAFSSNRGSGGLFTMAPDGSNVTKIPSSKQTGDPAWQPQTLGLRASRTVVDAGQPLTLHAKLAWPEGGNTTVDVMRRDGDGGPWRPFESGQVDAEGDLAIMLGRVWSSASYRARWAGDAEHDAATSFVVRVDVRAVAAGALFRYDGTSGQYRLYHAGDRVWFRGKVRPNRHDARLCFELESFRSGRWRKGFFACYPIARNGSSTIYITGSPTGFRHRIRAVFRGDDLNLGDSSPWDYYRVVTGRSRRAPGSAPEVVTKA